MEKSIDCEREHPLEYDYGQLPELAADDRILVERISQIAQGFTTAADDALTPERWAALIIRHAGLAMPHTTAQPDDAARFYKQMIRLSAIARAAAASTLRKHGKHKEKSAGAFEGSGF